MELRLCAAGYGRATDKAGGTNIATDGVDRITPVFLCGIGNGVGRGGTVHQNTSGRAGGSQVPYPHHCTGHGEGRVTVMQGGFCVCVGSVCG